MLDSQRRAATDELLATFDLFAGLTEQERKRYLSRLNWYRVRAGEQVVDREGAGRNVFFVGQGLVRVVNYCQSGRQISFEDIGPGGFFGELSAIDGKARYASVVAVEETRLASMSAQVFIPLVTTHPEVALALMKRLASMVRQASKRIVEVSTLAAQSRVNAELLRRAGIRRVEGNAAMIRPAPVHSEIASRVSTTRETVARVLNTHVRSGLIARRRGALVINDIERLAAMVEEFGTATPEAPASRVLERKRVAASPGPMEALMTTAKHVLIVEDDEGLRTSLGEQLELHEGFVVHEAGDGKTARELLGQHEFEVILLDVGLPDIDGRDLCRLIRRQGVKTPIIMLTSFDTDADTILGLDSGANDYIAKPFRLSVLFARLRTQRRQFELSDDVTFAIGPYAFKPSAKMLVNPETNRKLHLTEKEAAILKYLYRVGDGPVSREILLEQVWGYNPGITTHTVETHVHRIRQKIEPDPAVAQILLTEPGGYRLAR